MNTVDAPAIDVRYHCCVLPDHDLALPAGEKITTMVGVLEAVLFALGIWLYSGI